MNKLVYSVLSFVFILSAAAQTSIPKGVKKPTPVAPLAIPASAVKQPDGNYRYVDEKGTAWIYRNTPFGVSRATEAAVKANAAMAQAASATAPSGSAKPAQDRDEKVTAVANGDTIQFARPTPFGVTRWSKNKSDLTPDEQKIWDREQAKRNQ
jgi:hypothetical protein